MLYYKPFPDQKIWPLHVFLYTCFTYESFQTHKIISCASLFTEAALNVGNELIFLQVPDESAIDHAFDHFTQTACKRYWAYSWMDHFCPCQS